MRLLRCALLCFLGAAGALGQKPQIYVDNVNGSALASGSPEAIGPISALATCHTNGASSSTIQWTSNGLSAAGVPTDGSAVLFLNTASGRKFSRITGLATNTVTVANNFNIAAGTPVDCAVGGRLLNVTPQLGLDTEGGATIGWQIFVVNTGVNYTWAAAIVLSGGTGAGIFGVPDAGVLPTIDCTFQPGTCLSIGFGDAAFLEIRNTNGTKTGTVGVQVAGGTVRHSIIGGSAAATAFETGITHQSNRSVITGNLIRSSGIGLAVQSNDSAVFIGANVFQGNLTGLRRTGSNTSGVPLILSNIFWSNSTAGIDLSTTNFARNNAILFNTFYGNSVGLLITDPSGLLSLLFASNLLTNNTTGVQYTGAARNVAREAAMIDFNCYGQGSAANGADLSGFVYGSNVIHVDPQYANAAGGDFTPTNKDTAFRAWPPGLNGLTPRFFPGTTTESQVRCGAIQPNAEGGGGNVGI